MENVNKDQNTALQTRALQTKELDYSRSLKSNNSPSTKTATPQLYRHFESSWQWKALSILFPGQCLLCRAGAKHSLCRECLADLPYLGSSCQRCAIPLHCAPSKINNQSQFLECGACQAKPPSFDQSLSAFEYRFPIDKLIHTFKDSGNLRLGRLMSSVLSQKIKTQLSGDSEKYDIKLPECILAVPMYPSKQRQRGFNQAEFIAKELSKALDIPIIDILQKIKSTPDQHALNRKERIKNLKNCFELDFDLVDKNKKPIKHVVIVDDVMTTGATANEISQLLKKNGAKSVKTWTLARTQKPS